MNYKIYKLLDEEQVSYIRQLISPHDYWEDGLVSLKTNKTQDHGGHEIKKSEQLLLGDAQQISSKIVYDALDANSEFKNFCLPTETSSVLFTRTHSGGYYKPHFDKPSLGEYSNTLFLSDPSEYDGGELTLWLNDKEETFKLEPGMVVSYHCGTPHQVKEVTGGTREVAVFWTRSQIKNDRLRFIMKDLLKCMNLIEDMPPFTALKEALNHPQFLLQQSIYNLERYIEEE